MTLLRKKSYGIILYSMVTTLLILISAVAGVREFNGGVQNPKSNFKFLLANNVFDLQMWRGKFFWLGYTGDSSVRSAVHSLGNGPPSRIFRENVRDLDEYLVEKHRVLPDRLKYLASTAGHPAVAIGFPFPSMLIHYHRDPDLDVWEVANTSGAIDNSEKNLYNSDYSKTLPFSIDHINGIEPLFSGLFLDFIVIVIFLYFLTKTYISSRVFFAKLRMRPGCCKMCGYQILGCKVCPECGATVERQH